MLQGMQPHFLLETDTMGFKTCMDMAIAWRHVIDRFSVCLHQGGGAGRYPNACKTAMAASGRSRCCICLPVSEGQQSLLQCSRQVPVEP